MSIIVGQGMNSAEGFVQLLRNLKNIYTGWDKKVSLLISAITLSTASQVGLCQTLWKLAGSRQSYGQNYQAYFFGPPCILQITENVCGKCCNLL